MKSLIKLFAKILFLFSMLLFTSCDDNNQFNSEGPIISSETELFKGSWVESSYENEVITMQRTNTLAKDAYAFSVSSNRVFKENKNTGWCGTPPVAYGVYEGTWSKIADNLFEVNTTSWHGETSFRIEIVSVDEQILKIKMYFE